MKTPAEMGFDPRIKRVHIDNLPESWKRSSACEFCPIEPLFSESKGGCIEKCGPNHVFFDPIIHATKRLRGKA